jgi:hypothetical protein
MAYQSEHTGAEVDAAVSFVNNNMTQLTLLMDFLSAAGNARIHPTTKNLQGKIGTDFHDLGVEDQGDSTTPIIMPVAAQTPDND